MRVRSPFPVVRSTFAVHPQMPPSLLSHIIDRIRSTGPLTVADYVDEALYHQELGYYARAAQRSGRSGDFYTAVDLGPVFGMLLGVEFADMWRALSAGPSRPGQAVPPGFDLVEAAAGNGRLARDILDHAEQNDRQFYESVRLHLVERSPGARARQASVLGPHSRVLVSSGASLPAGTSGVIYANELLDALPPHLVVMREDGLREVYVDAARGRLVTREEPPSSPRLAEYLDAVGARLEPGWFAEVNLAAADWVRQAAASLARGFVVIIDYGHEAPTLYSAARAAGTLTTYRKHASESRDDSPGWLLEPGDRDITSHVDLTGVELAGREAGLALVGVADQSYFLLGLAERAVERLGESPLGLERRLALKTLLLPGGMGSTHKVIVFAKSIDGPALAGLCFGGRVT